MNYFSWSCRLTSFIFLRNTQVWGTTVCQWFEVKIIFHEKVAVPNYLTNDFPWDNWWISACSSICAYVLSPRILSLVLKSLDLIELIIFYCFIKDILSEPYSFPLSVCMEVKKRMTTNTFWFHCFDSIYNASILFPFLLHHQCKCNTDKRENNTLVRLWK